MKKVVSIITAFLLGVLGLTTLSVQTAEAHNSSVSADCTKLSVNLTNYATQTGKNNTVKVVINGDVKVDSTFGASYSNSWNFSQTQINTWSVKVVAWDNSSYNVDKSARKSLVPSLISLIPRLPILSKEIVLPLILIALVPVRRRTSSMSHLGRG